MNVKRISWLVLIVLMGVLGVGGLGVLAGNGGACAVPAGYTTIQSALDDPLCEIIDISAGTYNENLSLFLDRNVELRGAGRGSTIVDGGAVDEVLRVAGDNSAFLITARDMTLQNGTQGAVNASIYVHMRLQNVAVVNNNGPVPLNNGGGVANSGWMTISFSLIADNDVTGTGDGGGGIGNTGNMFVENSVIENNMAGTNGGGIHNIRNLTVVDSVVQNNFAAAGGGGIHHSLSFSNLLLTRTQILDNGANSGGGLYVTNGRARVFDSTIAGNVANSEGGGAYHYNGDVGSIYRRTTFHDNESLYGGSALAILNGTADVGLENVTVSGNRSTTTSPAFRGGALDNAGVDSWLWLTSTTVVSNVTMIPAGAGGVTAEPGTSNSVASSIIAFNADGAGAERNCDAGDGASYYSGGNNIESLHTCNLGVTGDQLNTNPLIEALADNGGYVLTHALQDGSPAIDMGHVLALVESCLPTDARGFARPVDGDGNPDPDTDCDAGAYEYGAVDPNPYTEFLYLPIAVRP